MKEKLYNLYGVFAGILVFIIYLLTLAPNVIQIDSGELAAVQATLGIAHPTGYPLFTVFGYIFQLIPLPFSTIFKLNILASLWCASSVTIFIYTAKLILENIHKFEVVKSIKKKKKVKDKKSETTEDNNQINKISTTVIYISSLFGGLFLAFSKTFWFQSTSVEVYSLHLFFITLIIYFLVKAYVNENQSELKGWLIFAAVLALGFGNHMTTLLILPGVAFLFFNKLKFGKDTFLKLGKMLALFFPALFLIYSYLPLRAAQNPVLNWGNPVDMERILRHVSGKQYQVWLFSSTEAAKKQFNYFINNITDEYNIILLISLLGLIYTFTRARKLFFFLLITFISTVLYSINYDISDIDAYFLLAYIVLAFFASAAFVKIFEFFKTKKHRFGMPVIIGFVFASTLFYVNYGKVDQSDQYTFEDYTKALLNSVEKNGIVFSYQWDYFLSASYYYQFVESFRKDVIVIDKELLRRSWYYNQIETSYPKVINNIKSDVEPFLKALQPFERSENYNAPLLQNLFVRLMTNLVSKNEEHKFYIGPEIFDKEMREGEFVLPEGYTVVPDNFMFIAVKDNKYVEASDPNFKIRFREKRNHYDRFIEESLVGPMLARRAFYELQFDKVEKAKFYVNKLLNEFPNYRMPMELIQAVGRVE